MSDTLVAHEALVRLAAFSAVFGLMATWEHFLPRRTRVVARAQRWPANLAVAALNAALVRWLLPTTAVAFASMLEARQIGLLAATGLPGWAVMLTGLVLLDLVIYFQHVLFHAVPVFWRMHRMHHADLEVDATNGLRFHPLEIMLSMGYKFAIIAVLGPPAVAVVVFEVVLNALAVFNHSNAYLPERLDRMLRWIVVTPDMHRIHHSWLRAEHDSNYGFNLSCWDRVFGSYIAYPHDGQAGMTLGLPTLREARWRRLDQMLLQPLEPDAPDAFGPGAKASRLP